MSISSINNTYYRDCASISAQDTKGAMALNPKPAQEPPSQPTATTAPRTARPKKEPPAGANTKEAAETAAEVETAAKLEPEAETEGIFELEM